MEIDVVAIGELLADIISCENNVRLQDAGTFEIYPGGSPANVAANLAGMGKKVALISTVGKDGIGSMLLENIKKAGVKHEFIQTSETHPTSIVIVTAGSNTPEFIAYRGADMQLHTIEESLFEKAAIVHTTAFALSKEPARGAILNAVQTARQSGKTVSVDWNFSPLIWTDDGKEVFAKLMQLQPLLKISMDDAERFFATGNSVEGYKQILSACDAGFICLTCGKDGVWYKEGAGEWKYKPSLSVKKVVDTTGAGDAFWAGFLSAYIDKQPISKCMDNALATAAKKIQKKGPLFLQADRI